MKIWDIFWKNFVLHKNGQVEKIDLKSRPAKTLSYNWLNWQYFANETIIHKIIGEKSAETQAIFHYSSSILGKIMKTSASKISPKK